MLKLGRNRHESANSWERHGWQRRVQEAAVPDKKTAEVILWEMGLIVATALSVALAVNFSLTALHIGRVEQQYTHVSPDSPPPAGNTEGLPRVPRF